MFKFALISVFLFANFAFAGLSSEFLTKAGAFKKELDRRSMYLRHQVSGMIGDISKFREESERWSAIQQQKNFLRYLVESSSKMNVAAGSKKLVAAYAQDLLDIAATPRTQSHILERVGSVARKTDAVSNRQSSLGVVKERGKAQAIFSPMNPWGWSLGAFGALSIIFVLLRVRKKLRPSDLGGASGELELRDDSHQKALTFKMLEKAPMGVVCVDDSELVYWSNKSARETLGLTKGSSFFFSHELVKDPVTGREHFYLDQDHSKFLVDRSRASLKGKKVSILFFYPSIQAVERKSFRLSQGSEPLDVSLAQALERHNYLFSACSIPVSVERRGGNIGHAPEEVSIVDRYVYLGFQMAKDVPETRVDLTLQSARSKETIQMDIRNLRGDGINFNREVILSDGSKASLQDLWTELEVKLSKREGRLFMYNNDKGGFTVLLSYNRLAKTLRTGAGLSA